MLSLSHLQPPYTVPPCATILGNLFCLKCSSRKILLFCCIIGFHHQLNSLLLVCSNQPCRSFLASTRDAEVSVHLRNQSDYLFYHGQWYTLHCCNHSCLQGVSVLFGGVQGEFKELRKEGYRTSVGVMNIIIIA